jgi:pimeloyl-ACP methyl ester carboxylesterase
LLGAPEAHTGLLPRFAPDSSLRTLESGLKLHVEVSNPGSAPTIIFVHGLGGSSSNYCALIEASGVAKSHQIVTFDLEGHGLSPLSGEDVTVTGFAASIGEVLDNVGAQKAIVVAHSLGGVGSLLHAQICRG